MSSASTTHQQADPAVDVGSVTDRVRPSSRAIAVDAAWYVATGLVALALASIVLEVWDAQLRIPFGEASGDTAAYLLVFKLIVNGGSPFVADQVGAPSGLELYEFPYFADLGSLTSVWLMGWVSSDPVLIYNAYFLLGFGACAANAFLVLRVLGIPRGPAMVCGVLFGLLPYHFLRGQGHVLIGNYWVVPFGALLIFGALGRVQLFARRSRSGDGRVRSWMTPRTLLTVSCALVVGTALHYYALFALVLLGLVAILRALAGRSLRAAATPLVVMAIIGAGVTTMVMPTLVYRMGNGTNELVAQRQPQEAEAFALKITHLLLPIEGHRVGALRDVANEYAATTESNAENGSSAGLGLALGGGLLAGVAVLLIAALGTGPATRFGRLLRDSGLLGLLTVLVGTVGGGSALISYLLTAQVRGWGRISVYIAFFAVVGLAVLLTMAQRRLASRPHGGVLAALGLVAVGGLGVADQTSEQFRPGYEGAAASWRSDARFVGALEERLPRSASVLQLPYIAFPESPSRFRAVDYDHLRGFLHGEDLRWSYGAMKGRPSDWAAEAQDLPTDELLAAAAAAGFRGVWIDTYAYGDGGIAIVDEVTAVTSAPVTLRSEDGRFAFFDLDVRRLSSTAELDAGERRAVGQALLRPIGVEFGSGFYDREGDGTTTWHWGGRAGVVGLENPAPGPRRVRMSLTVDTPGPTRQPVTLRMPDGSSVRILTQPEGTPVVREFVVPAGSSELALETSAPDDGVDPRDLRMQIVDSRFVDTNLDLVAGS